MPRSRRSRSRWGRGSPAGGGILVTGGRAGVMEAASHGAASAGGLVIGVLPGDSAAEANPFVAVPIVTGLGEARNVIIARTADALIALPGEYGTLAEIAFALKFGKPVVSLRCGWDLGPQIIEAASAADAVSRAFESLGLRQP